MEKHIEKSRRTDKWTFQNTDKYAIQKTEIKNLKWDKQIDLDTTDKQIKSRQRYE
jgi:hypothetical protein